MLPHARSALNAAFGGEERTPQNPMTNQGVDLFSGLQYYSAHNIPALTHRYVVCTSEGTTVFFAQRADAERYAQRLVRRNVEDEVGIFVLQPLTMVRTTAPTTVVERLDVAPEVKALQENRADVKAFEASGALKQNPPT